MADDDRRRGPGQRGAAAEDAAGSDTVVLPEHASAYFSPRSPPVSTAHQTIETEAVRLDPAIDPDNAVTQPLSVDGLAPPPWLVERVRSDAPTVLVPIVRQRRKRRRLVAGVVAAAIGVAAGIVYGFTRPLSPRQTATSAVAPVPSLVPATARSAEPVAVSPPPVVSAELAAKAALVPAPSATAEQSAQLVVHSVPTSRVPVVRHAASATSAPSAWLKSEPPKAWFK